MEIIAAVVGSITACLCTQCCGNPSVVDQCKQMLSSTNQLERLRKNVADLNAEADDVRARLLIAESEPGNVRTNVVQNWLNGVEEVRHKMNTIEDEVKEAKKCLNVLLPHCCSRLDMGQRISNLIAEVTGLAEKRAQFSNEGLYMKVASNDMKIPTTTVVATTTTQKNMEQVWQWLHADIRKIGVYGMGGVGKTTIMAEIHNRLVKDNQHFDKVIWITVPKDAGVRKLQDKIAEKLNLDLSNEQDDAERSQVLFHALELKKRFVLILDDMWESFLLHTVGIPEPTKENGCKLILTTRSLEVCRKMGCREENILKVKPLLEEEAWELFLNKVDVELAPEVRQVAKDFVAECDGLPLAIITIARAMKGNNDISEWRVALNKLRDSNNQTVDMEENVFKCLKFSYDQLDDEVLKQCFLFCALYTERITTHGLIVSWILDGSINGRNRQDELDQGETILNKLRHCCLLESVIGGIEEEVKMHDLLRDLALQITSGRFMVKAGLALEEVPNESEWGERLERASFMDYSITQISISPECPRLSTLIFCRGPYLRNINHDFFIHMHSLKILDLCENPALEILPDSISDLVNLRALRLRYCTSLKRVPSLAKMVLLSVLDIGGTSIEELPHGMEMLVNLKYLVIFKTKLRNPIPTGLLTKFPLLQQLVLLSKEMDKICKLGGEGAFVEELASLKHLEILGVSFPSALGFVKYASMTNFNGLKEFRFVVGDPYSFRFLSARSVEIHCNADVILQNELSLPENTECFGISEFPVLKSLAELRCLRDAKRLRVIHIKGCENLEYMLSSYSEGTHLLLQHLEEIDISFCDKLSTVYKGIPPRVIFPCLKKLVISDCSNLKSLFSSSGLLERLQNLETLHVYACFELEKLIAEKQGEKCEGSITLSKLKILKLWDLPKLKSICERDMICNSLEKIHVIKCIQLKYLFSTSWVQHFQSLQEILIFGCDEMEELIVEQEMDQSSSSTSTCMITLPKLRQFSMRFLPKLKSIWKGVMLCDSLQIVVVHHCDELKRLPQLAGHEQSPPPNLRGIRGSIDWWDLLEWDSAYLKLLLQPYFKVKLDVEEENNPEYKKYLAWYGYNAAILSPIIRAHSPSRYYSAIWDIGRSRDAWLDL